LNKLTNQRAYEDIFQIENMPTSCLLCQTGKLEKLGHVIPKFVMRWLKEASKHKSFYFNNDQKVFDTPAFRMMCNTCEAKLSTLEKYFTDNIFKKYYRKKSPNPIQDDVYNFAISIAWRLIVFTERLKSTQPQQQAFKSTYALSESLMRDYLNGKIKSCEHSVYALPIENLTKNISKDKIDEHALNYSIRQGLKAHRFKDEINNKDLSLRRIPTIHFKLGCYYFLIFPDNYFAGAEFSIESTKISKSKELHLLEYTPDLLGFMDWLMEPGPFEINVKDLAPTNYIHRNSQTLWDISFGSKRAQKSSE